MPWEKAPPLSDGWVDGTEIETGDLPYNTLGNMTYESAGELRYNSTSGWGLAAAEVNPWD